ncbi:hypothetical protein PG990_002019 [Apiospora arundinis]
MNTIDFSALDGRDISWSTIPTDLLIAEISRRQDAGSSENKKPVCGSGEKGSYDTPLHVFALVLILVLSTLACGFPLFSRRASSSRRSHRIIFLCQHFGTGVLLATAFVHLLPTAFLSLTDPCLPHIFSKGYRPMAGLIAMVSALVVVSIESYLTTRGAGHSHSHGHGWESEEEEELQELTNGAGNTPPNGSLAAKRASNHRPAELTLNDLGDREGLMAGASPLPESTPTSAPSNSTRNHHHRKGDDDDDDLDLDLDELDPTNGDDALPLAGGRPTHKRQTSEASVPHIPNPEEQKRLMIQLAITFHQTFEGLALGSRIAAIHFPKHSIRPWLMVLAYGTTTPFGQAIGLVVHRMYDPMSQTGLLMVGFMNAISSGLLLFAGLVQLLAEDFLTEKSYKTLKGQKRTHAFLAVIAGATLMAAVGAFA